jgi:hypothetical protein
VILGEVSDKFLSLPDGPARATFDLDVFGKGGLALLPILSAGSAALRKYGDDAERVGAVMSEKDLAASKELGIA